MSALMSALISALMSALMITQSAIELFAQRGRFMFCLVISILGILSLSSQLQAPILSEKRAVTGAQSVFASQLDAKLPTRPFADWFRQVVGPQAGVTWQLNECGEHPSILISQGRDLPACAEVNALLPDERKVVVMIQVGTFKKGIIGIPEFFFAAIEQRGELSPVGQLHDLPEMLRSRVATAKKSPVKLVILDSHLPLMQPKIGDVKSLSGDSAVETVPPPPMPSPMPKQAAEPTPRRESSEVPESMLLGNAIVKVQPLYPVSAKKVNASGPVQVKVTISAEGRVIEAAAISGHPLLRRAAVEAAGKWIFKPSMLNGVPVQVQSVLTFIFAPPQ